MNQNVNMFKEETKEYTCCLCHKKHRGYGNNPYPLITREDARACDDCNLKVVKFRAFLSDVMDGMSEEEAEAKMEYYEQLPLSKKLYLMSQNKSASTVRKVSFAELLELLSNGASL